MSDSIRTFLPQVEIYKAKIEKDLLNEETNIDMLGIAMIEFLEERGFTPEIELQRIMKNMQGKRLANFIEQMRDLCAIHQGRVDGLS